MKNYRSRMNKPSMNMWAILGKKYKLRHNLSLRGEDKQQPTRSPNNMAEWLQILEQHISHAPVIDIQKRNTIRNAIVTGGYTIDPVSVAEKFIRFELDLNRHLNSK